MMKPTLLDGLSVDPQPRVRACGHGLTGRRVRSDLHNCPVDACHAARRRVLDHAGIWRPRKGTAQDQVLLSRVYGNPFTIAEDVALYAPGFNAVWAVIPDQDLAVVVMARSVTSSLWQEILRREPIKITETHLIGADR